MSSFASEQNFRNLKIKRSVLLFAGQNYPRTLFLVYFLVGFGIFWIAPFNWTIENGWWITLYFICMMLMFWFGFQSRMTRVSFVAKKVPFRTIIVIGAIAACLLLIPTTYLYSGKYPWQFSEMLADQKQAYFYYQNTLRETTTVDRLPIALLRTALYPLIFAVLPLGGIYWRQLSTIQKLSVLAVIFCSAITSLARGTDRESFDVLLFIFFGWLISFARAQNAHRAGFLWLKNSKVRLVIFATLFLVLLFSALSVFMDRKQARYGEGNFHHCFGTYGDICTDESAWAYTYLGDGGAQILTSAAGYMSQGYYGLGLALGLPFQSTLGIGNSPMIATQYANITGDNETYQQSYTYRMRTLGWTDEYQWSTLMVWIANDFSFPGALIILFFLAAIFGASWRDAVMARDDCAAIVFILFVDLFLYLPANNQLGQSLDTLFTTLFWISIWQYRKMARGRTIQ